MFTAPQTTLGELGLLFLGAVGPIAPSLLKKSTSAQPSRVNSHRASTGDSDDEDERIDFDDDRGSKVSRERSKSKSTNKKKKPLHEQTETERRLAAPIADDYESGSTGTGECQIEQTQPHNSVFRQQQQGAEGHRASLLPQSPSQLDPILERLYAKFIRFLIFRRIAQILGFIAVGVLVLYGSQVVFIDPGTLPEAGTYNLEDDVLCWLQALGILLGIWYSWVPLQCRGIVLDGMDSLMPVSSSIQAELLSENGGNYHTNSTAEDDT